MTDPAEVFLSYKAEDRPRLKPLVTALEAEGFGVWWDAHIGGGANWREEIQDHLDVAKCVIVAWTKRSIGREGNFVRDEATRAQRRGVYLPIRLDSVAPPLGFGEVQALSLTRWKGDRSDPRFRAVVDAVRSRISGEGALPHVPAHDDHPRVSRRAVMAGGAAAVAAAGTGGWLLLKPTAANTKRIAVLPFANLSSDKEQAFFSDGIAEELRAALSRIGLQVIGRASSNEVKDLNTKAAAAKLGVGNILTGSIRRSPNLIRVNAQLVSGSDGVERWARSYDRAPGDAIKIQTDIAANVAQALSVALGTAGRIALTLGGTTDSAAQDLAMRAREISASSPNADDLRRSIRLLNAAIARDPQYADAYWLKARHLAGLGAAYAKSPADMVEMLAQAEVAAKHAIQIAPKLGPAYAALSIIELYRLNFANALQLMEQALTLSPNVPSVLSTAQAFIDDLGDQRHALRIADEIISLEPLQPGSYAGRAWTLFLMRRYPEAIADARKTLEIAPDYVAANGLIGYCLMLLERPAEARAEYAKAPPDHQFRLVGEAILAARARDWRSLEKKLLHLREIYGDAASYQYGQIYAQAGHTDRAFQQLEKALQENNAGLISLKRDAFLDPIRGDRRYADLVRRLRFP